MKMTLLLLKISLALLCILLGLDILILLSDLKGGPGAYTLIGGYIGLGVIMGFMLIAEFNSINRSNAILFSALYTILFFVPAMVLAVFVFMMIGEC